MKRVFEVLFVGTISIGLIGCGGGGEPTNIVEGQQSAVESYDALLAADAAAMTEEVAATEEAAGTEEVAAPEE